MNVAILGSRGFPSTYGGFETFVARLAPALAGRGHQVTVYCRNRPPGARRHAWIADRVKCRWTPGMDTKSASTLSFGFTSHLDAARRRFDVALVLNVANGFFLPILRTGGIPAVVNTDGLEWQREKWNSTAQQVFYQAARLTTRFADVLVSDSAAICDIWYSEFGVRPQFVPYGADVTPYAGTNLVRRLGLTPRAYALIVARLVPENTVDLTLDALDLVRELPAVVVGTANYRSPLESRVRRLAQAGRVRWLGHVDDHELLTELWANAAVYIHGHSVGGTNPALLQALGAGAAVLALDTPFNYEVLASSEQLYPRDAAALAVRIRKVVGDDSLRHEWSGRGRRIIQERYLWEPVIDAYEEALFSASARRQPHSERSL